MTAFVEFGSLSLYAQFADGPTPRVHTQSDIEGSCRIVSYTPSQCRTDCGSDALCVDGECQDYPSRNSPGTLQLEWADGSATIEPNGIGQYSHSDSTDVHGEMTVQVDGMTLTNPSMQPPTPVGDWGEALTERGNGDGELTWSDPIEGARIRLRMTDCTGSHGGLSDNEIECEGPDTGMLTIPAGFLDLLDDGDWNRGECGSHYVERYVASSPADDDATRFESIARVHLFYRGDGQ